MHIHIHTHTRDRLHGKVHNPLHGTPLAHSNDQTELPSHISAAGLAQLGERQTEDNSRSSRNHTNFTHLSEGRVFDPHKPQSPIFLSVKDRPRFILLFASSIHRRVVDNIFSTPPFIPLFWYSSPPTHPSWYPLHKPTSTQE